ncbi:hypothetical protein B0T21DRAFT_381256 [Apiosordaria backusii]|uniref:Uncharacterized protein n=1 Tax=Apiosordaria backusii TaxID=314023 RepID=A0AA40ETE1_9PEZI|nr:hypothetical protein B0T21DRAFT_381256 [Apiosordaria backusii]
MSPTHTMSAHLCKQIVSSWRESRQSRHSSPESSPLPSPPNNATSYFPRSLSPKSSMDNGDRHHDTSVPISRQTSNSNNWRWGSR